MESAGESADSEKTGRHSLRNRVKQRLTNSARNYTKHLEKQKNGRKGVGDSGGGNKEMGAEGVSLLKKLDLSTPRALRTTPIRAIGGTT